MILIIVLSLDKGNYLLLTPILWQPEASTEYYIREGSFCIWNNSFAITY